MELRDYVRVLRAHWMGFLLVTLLCVAAAGVFTLTREQKYAANANGFVTTGQTSDAALASVNDSLSQSRAKSYVDIAESRATAQRVIDALDLEQSPASLISDITVSQPAETVLIKITARSTSAKAAQQLADAWVTALSEQVAAIENPDANPSSGATKVVPVEAASLPSKPVSPNARLNLLIGLVLGMALGLGYALVRNQLDRRIRSSAEIEKNFATSVVGTIPAAKRLEREPEHVATLAVSGDTDGRGAEAAEAFRKLRTNLAFMDVDNPPRVIVVTSPHQGDGKSTVSANLAAAIAVTGQSVTLVDGDLRRPTLADTFGLVEGAGLTDVLIGRADVADVRQPHPSYAALSMLAAGGIPPNPSELLGSRAMRTLLAELSQDGMVIIDAPPVLPVTDAAVLTAHADGCLVVVSHGKTLDTELTDALENIGAVNGRLLGIIFNRVPRHNDAGGYYGNYYRYAKPEKSDRQPAHAAAPQDGQPPADVPTTHDDPRPAGPGRH